MLVGLEIATVLKRLYPEQFEVSELLLLLGNEETIAALQKDTPPQEIVASWNTPLADFDARRRKYFLYK
jgi:uncharacterized protein YbbC (DUF1343 family)